MTTTKPKTKRRFIDARDGDRCMADIVMRDGSLAQCGRHKKVGDYCTQHARIKALAETTAA